MGQRGVLILAIGVGVVLGGLAWLRHEPAWGAAAVVAMLGLAGWGWWLERTWIRPIRRLTHNLDQRHRGHPTSRYLPAGSGDPARLVTAFNQFLEDYDARITSLTAELQRARNVLHNMADGIIIADSAGVVSFVNPAACQLLNRAAVDSRGRSVAQGVRQHEIIELWQRCQAQQTEQTGAAELGSGKLFLQVIVAPLFGGGAPGYLLILQDLTQVRPLQTVRQDFISNISHELRTPLASLRAVIETLQDGALDDPPAAQRFLGRAEAEVDTLTQMVEELLELSRIESGQVPLRLAAAPVPEIILPAVERLQPQAMRAELRVDVQLSADLPPVLADAARVQQVVLNLLHNAIKFTPPGGIITVEAGLSPQHPNALLVKVSDTGIGIPARELPRIFERFYKGDRARARGGTGLGLAIAKHIVQAHGGRIWARSREGKGSQFFFTLPLSDR